MTILNTVQVSPGITGGDEHESGATSPPDPAGAEGNGDIAVMVNGLFNVYSTSGQLLLSESATAFWTNAGAAPKGSPFSSRILFDPNTNRWVAVALDTNIIAGVEQAGNNVLIAVSDYCQSRRYVDRLHSGDHTRSPVEPSRQRRLEPR